MGLNKAQQLAIATRGYLGGGPVTRLSETVVGTISEDKVIGVVDQLSVVAQVEITEVG